MIRRFLVLAALLWAGCASSRVPGGDDDDSPPVDAPAIDGEDDVDAPAIDAPGQPIDAPTGGPDAPVASGAVALVLTEIALAPNGAELIEVFNPTTSAVDLHDYFLTDVPTYFRLPAGAQTVDSSDFIVRFPIGATLAPGGIATVAMDTTANFMTTLGAAPTYSIAGATMVVVQISGTATLTNGGEPVVLFYWDGASDRVTDVDIMVAGAPSLANQLVNKSGVAVDGPDADTAGTAYATDALTITAQGSTPGSGLSTKRIARESATTETQGGGGNGVGGHDETSEQSAITWDATGYTAPTPGAIPPALLP